MLRRITRTLLMGTLLLLLAGMASFLYLCWQINHTGAQDQARSADAIIVLGARVQPDGQPGPDLRSRTLHAVDLFHRGLAPYLICTGGYHDDRLSAAAIACDLAIAEGVPADRILLADGSMTTSEDAASARHQAAIHGLQTAILVSHPLHLERARVLFEAEGIVVYPSPTSTDLAAIPWRDRAWLTAREAVGILWSGLEELGVPYDWTTPLSHWVYGLPARPATGAN
ncbi:YdcF family protein [Chloroflexota bacterium]